MKKLSVLLVVALATAAVISLDWGPASFEERAIALELDQAPADIAATLHDEPLEVKAVVLDYLDDRILLLKTQAALLKYPTLARAVLPAYGDTPEFKEILAAHGESILPPIYYFMNNEIAMVSVAHYAAQKMRAVKTSARRLLGGGQNRANGATAIAHPDPDSPAGATTPLTPEQRGWYAVNYIRAEGHNFLGQFVMNANGNPAWNQTERVTEGASMLFTSGIRELETKLRTEQTVTTGDVGWATVDAVAVLGATKLLRAGRAATASGGSFSASGRTAALTSRITLGSRWAASIAQHGKWPAIIVAAYIALRHPSVIGDVLADIANAFGVPAWLGLLIGWTLILLPLLYVGGWLLRPIAFFAATLLNTLQRLLSWLDRLDRPKPKTAAIPNWRGPHRPVRQNDFLT